VERSTCLGEDGSYFGTDPGDMNTQDPKEGCCCTMFAPREQGDPRWTVELEKVFSVRSMRMLSCRMNENYRSILRIPRN